MTKPFSVGKATFGDGRLTIIAGPCVIESSEHALMMARESPLLATQYDESEIALSPDGRWLAYVSDETGRPEVFLRPFPEVDSAKYQVSTSGAQSPLWSRDGRELFFLGLDRQLVAVSVAPRPDPKLGERRTLFRLGSDYYPPAREYYSPFDVAPEGRFLMARRVRGRDGAQAPLLVTTNWFSEVRRQVGDQEARR